MEGTNGRKSSSSSSSSPPSTGSGSGSNLTNDLFGPKPGSVSGKPSTGIFDSVFSNPSMYGRSEAIGTWRKKESENQGWKSKGNTSQASEGQGQASQKKGRSSIFLDEKKAEPHYLSSSLYYGGQDVCSNPSDSRSSPHAYKKDEEDDGSNPHSAARGNWWQGGLYY